MVTIERVHVAPDIKAGDEGEVRLLIMAPGGDHADPLGEVLTIAVKWPAHDGQPCGEVMYLPAAVGRAVMASLGVGIGTSDTKPCKVTIKREGSQP